MPLTFPAAAVHGASRPRVSILDGWSSLPTARIRFLRKLQEQQATEGRSTAGSVAFELANYIARRNANLQNALMIYTQSSAKLLTVNLGQTKLSVTELNRSKSRFILLLKLFFR